MRQQLLLTITVGVFAFLAGIALCHSQIRINLSNLGEPMALSVNGEIVVIDSFETYPLKGGDEVILVSGF